MSADPVSRSLAQVRKRIVDACRKYGRETTDVNLLAVTKTVDIGRIGAAIAEGQHDFGENYLQEAGPKIAAVNDRELTWHYIGAIQSNKTALIAERFSWVHTVSRTKIGARLALQRPTHLAPLKVLVQVNVSGEATKGGVEPEDAARLVESMLELKQLELRGLMAIPALRQGFDAQRREFRRLRQLKDEIKARYGDDLPHFQDLSMGMSADMEAAIAEGATWLRIGTAIFGPRHYKD